jgi:hypothetical protein
MATCAHAYQSLTYWVALSWCWHFSEYLALAALSNIACESVLAINSGELPGTFRRTLLSISTVIIFLKLVNLMITQSKTHDTIKAVEKKVDVIDKKIDTLSTDTSANFATSETNQKEILEKQFNYHTQTQETLEQIELKQDQISKTIANLEAGLLEKIKKSIQETLQAIGLNETVVKNSQAQLKNIEQQNSEFSKNFTTLFASAEKAQEDRNKLQASIDQLLKKAGCATESEVPQKVAVYPQQTNMQNIGAALLFNPTKK